MIMDKTTDCKKAVELHIERRTDRNGKPSIAPFINGWNIWDIPPEHWCEAVQQAVLHAYELGWRNCNDAHAEIQNHHFNLNARFKEPSP